MWQNIGKTQIHGEGGMLRKCSSKLVKENEKRFFLNLADN